MFNIDPLKALKKKVQPTIASGGLMGSLGDLKAIKESKDKTLERDEANIDKFNELCNKGMEDLDSFSEGNGNSLIEAVKKFSEAIEIKKNRPEPFFFLSYIACIDQNTEVAIKYFQAAKLIDPEFPGLDEIKNQLDLLLTGEPEEKAEFVIPDAN